MTEPNPPRSGGDFLTKKIGPLPGWAWGLIGVGGLLTIYLMRGGKSDTAMTDTSSSGSSTPDSDIPMFINQTYTSVQPPAATTPTNTGPSAPMEKPTYGPSSSNVQGLRMFQISKAQAQYLLNQSDIPHIYNKSKNQYVTTGKAKSPSSIANVNGPFYATAYEYVDLLKNGSVKGA